LIAIARPHVVDREPRACIRARQHREECRLPSASLGGVEVRVKAIMAVSGMLWCGSLGLDGSERVVLRAPASTTTDLTISVSVERHEDNRMLRVTAESPDFFRSSELPLNGEASPRVNVVTFHQLPSGEYDIRAVLIAANGKTAGAARTSVVVF
jgi:hypothetical protein